MDETFFTDFEAGLRIGGRDSLCQGLIGEGAPIPGPFGVKPLVYADYVASGRALKQIEDFVLARVLPYYANSHTEASFCGSYMTRIRQAARAHIARLCGAGEGFSTVFCGSGATEGLNRLVHLLGVPEAAEAGRRPVVFIGPYEHHSNILPWRESGAEVITIGEAACGGPDLEQLDRALAETDPARLRIGAFSAVSNVTGIITDVDAVTKVLKSHGALAVWDYAGGGPYLPISMRAGTVYEKDAVVISAHKFVGGPAASGIMIVRDAVVARTRPVLTGGGTVRFVSPWGHDYATSLESREEAGTPNVIGNIRAALAFLVKDAMGEHWLDARHHALRTRAEQVWRQNPHIEIVGNARAQRYLPIFSFRVHTDGAGNMVHQQLFTRMLSDLYGIQARGGCACAGPYAHNLLAISRKHSDTLRQAILNGDEIRKPGWTRLNFCALMSDDKADFIIRSVDELARNPTTPMQAYMCDTATARFRVEQPS
ncbi:aminotransferase class V-fold PLP-dependent enzyme [Komagataeibacter medellinensis]|uniref:Aminotransferase class V-fold PLP-dependent enzyme n=1 Tax=Komagataeibacter medellinensis TaxID=1177712 RepID=A0ABQ6VVT9_9PROT|nr:aminotransferase class V-fold PLP-dependent enzyme [Komagataeibacter medellinensis]KAB8124322.1 aminotransferase class V-fold PLP-dependent enzyme [Komagataeibacter medellinensis]